MGSALGAIGGIVSSLGSMGGGGGGGGAPQIEFDAIPFSNEANKVLDAGLKNAIVYSEHGTQFAIEALKNFYRQTRSDVMDAEGRARVDYTKGVEMANATLEPYVQGGYGAYDKLHDIMGLARPMAGYGALAAAEKAKAQRNAALAGLQQAGQRLLEKLPNLHPDDKRNLRYAVNAGLNPEGILRTLQEDMGITRGDNLFRTDFKNPEINKLGGQIEGGEGGEITGGGPGEKIPSILGDIMNDLGKFNNDIYGDFGAYINTALPLYNQLTNARVSPQQQSLLNATRNGMTAAGAIPMDVYRR